jgi:type III restriction enzyme
VKLQLKEFQEEGVEDLLTATRKALRGVTEDDDLVAVVFSAPTGSGKTVMAAAWMEAVLNGTPDQPPSPDATFLWITDQPELNEQTRRKILSASSVFGASDLVTIDQDFDQPVLDAGQVYFLNTQKLGRATSYVSTGDDRTNTIWQIIEHTRAVRPHEFWLVLDEAHRGTGGGNGRATILRRLIVGDPEVGLKPTPLIFGVSATPEKFEDLLRDTDRVQRPVRITPHAVRDSGLLKDMITLFHRDEEQKSDFTMLAAAAHRLGEYEDKWNAYQDAYGRPRFRPILVVQVQDGTGKKLSNTDLAECLTLLAAEIPRLSDDMLGHAFQEKTSVALAGHTIRYVAPSDIQDDDDLRVVFFKTSLTTGWDCPRAEVMMSFRAHGDRTVIAQLVGRMVRTPLADRVAADEFLNTVTLYLPSYDKDTVEGVIEYLTEPNAERGTGLTGVQTGNQLVACGRRDGIDEVFVHAATMPTYSLDRASRLSATRRLLKFARLLAFHKIDKDELQRVRSELVARLEELRADRAADDAYKTAVKAAGEIDVRAVSFAYGAKTPQEDWATQTLTLTAVARNIDHAFAEAGRRLAGGMHSVYLKERLAADPHVSPALVKRELYALTADKDVIDACEQRAEQLLGELHETNKTAVASLSPEDRAAFARLRQIAGQPIETTWDLPQTIEIAEGKEPITYAKHLYADDTGKLRASLNNWEKNAVAEILADDDTVAWLRNVERKKWALAVPYRMGSDTKPLYPDFIRFRREPSGEIVADILDPHGMHLADAWARAVGLAEFAEKHHDSFSRVELIIEDGGTRKHLRLHEVDVRQKVKAVISNAHLKQLFDDESAS